MVHPLVGKPAPPLALPGADRETYTLTPGAKGVPTALFFYPKSGMRSSRTVVVVALADLPLRTPQGRMAAQRRHVSSGTRSQVSNVLLPVPLVRPKVRGTTRQ